MMQQIHGEQSYQEIAQRLAIKCGDCSGLCCVALYCAKAEGFPANKLPGVPCNYLNKDFRCAIHTQLKDKKLKGCMAFDCLGAGQKTTALFGGKDWRSHPAIAQTMYATFLTVWRLHQIQWYLLEAVTLLPAQSLSEQFHQLIGENEQMTANTPVSILALDIDGYQARANQQLKRAWSMTQSALKADQPAGGGDYMGKNFQKADLSGWDFSMALLIAADLTGCHLTGTNLLGADLRDTKLSGADLRECVFLTQSQLNAAKGDRSVKLPARLTYPECWR